MKYRLCGVVRCRAGPRAFRGPGGWQRAANYGFGCCAGRDRHPVCGPRALRVDYGLHVDRRADRNDHGVARTDGRRGGSATYCSIGAPSGGWRVDDLDGVGIGHCSVSVHVHRISRVHGGPSEGRVRAGCVRDGSWHGHSEYDDDALASRGADGRDGAALRRPPLRDGHVCRKRDASSPRGGLPRADRFQIRNPTRTTRSPGRSPSSRRSRAPCPMPPSLLRGGCATSYCVWIESYSGDS